MEVEVFFILVVPFILVFYLAVVLFMQPPRAVILASLAGGLLMALINVGVDILAYYAHWWHYTLDGLQLHVPLPFYFTPFLVYGAVVYLFIWRLWENSRWSWIARVLLFGVPIFGILRDVYIASTHTSITWDNAFAVPLDIVLWLGMFYAGFAVFRKLAPTREQWVARSANA